VWLKIVYVETIRAVPSATKPTATQVACRARKDSNTFQYPGAAGFWLASLEASPTLGPAATLTRFFINLASRTDSRFRNPKFAGRECLSVNSERSSSGESRD
jgi:hypothetical protein